MFQLLFYNFYVTTFLWEKYHAQEEKNSNRKSLGKTVTWQNHSVIAKYRILKILKWLKFKVFFPSVNLSLIFKSSRSQMFFKIGVLKNFAILVPFSNKVAGFLLQNTYNGCFWIFVAENTFLQLNFVFIADNCTNFCPRLLWKHELNLRSSHWSCSVKKAVFRNFQIAQVNTYAEVTFSYSCRPSSPQLYYKETTTRLFSVEFLKFLRTPNLKPWATASETCSFTWTAFFSNLDFRLKLVHML